jgi:hypothetical protein
MRLHYKTANVVGVTMSERRVAVEWSQRVAVVAHGHYKAALRFSKFQTRIGIPAVILTGIVSTSVFASLQGQPDLWWQIVVGVMSLTAAVLTALQSFLSYNERAERHRAAGARYNSVGRQLEQLLARDNDDWSPLTEIRAKIDSLAEESPHIPEAVHEHMAKIPVESMWKQ